MIYIGKNRECFFDTHLIDEEKNTAEHRIHHPVRKGVVMCHDAPWEGNGSDFHNFIYDNGVWRMYYLGWWYGYGKSVGIRLCYAESKDGIHWERMSTTPFLKNGAADEWNSSESGHPHIFTDEDGRTYLFYQGNNSKGKHWYLSQKEVFWRGKKPYLKE